LNSILDEMKQGESAVKRLQEMDQSRGLQDPVDVAKRMRGDNKAQRQSPPIQQSAQGILGDSQLAQQRLQQAERMAAEARGLLAESERLKAEAISMDPALAPASATKSKATEAAVPEAQPKVRKTRAKVSV
jgi:hypothetical protein